MVAIILVNYNGAEDTIDCIRSLSKVKNIDTKVIVVDNHSTDNSVNSLREVKQDYEFTLMEAEENNGFSAGNNIGIEYAKKKNAEYFLLLNNDTVVELDFLEHLIDGFASDENCGLTTSKTLYYSLQDTIWYAGGSLSMKTGRTTHYHYGDKDSTKDLEPIKVTFASGCCMCLSRKLVDKVGLLNEEFFLYEEDAEYCHRILKSGFSMAYVPKSVIYHKVSASTGQGSPMSQYYTIRNKYSLIRNNYEGINKVTAYIYNTLQMLFRCMKKELSFKCYRAAMKAFWRKEKGKVQVNL